MVAGLSGDVDRAGALARLAALARRDREIRSWALVEAGLSPEYELFIFGRPLTTILSAHGVALPLESSGPA